jgi:transcriptional regulator with GAF, ATPase, and Fis domain
MASSRFSAARLDQLLQQAREPAFWLSADLKLAWVNRAWEELTGHPAKAVSGLACRAHGPTRAGDLESLAGSLFPPPEAIAGQPAGAKTLFVHPTGERRWRRIEFWPFHNEAGELMALLGLVRPLEDPPVSSDSDGQRLRSELLEVRDRMLSRYGLDSLVGRGAAHRRLLDQVSAASTTSVPVLIIGEPGTGRRLVARAIHQIGPRSRTPIVPFDGMALPPEVLERELFGLRGSAGDPAIFPRLGWPEGSTLLISDVLVLPRDLQVRLASALSAGIRLIATSPTEPDAALDAGRLHPDLYYALTTLVIRLAPLRERLDELSLLAQHLLERANLRGGRQRSGFSAEAMRCLLTYDWPGNLRELARVIDDAHGRGQDDLIENADLPAEIRGHLGAAYTLPVTPPTVLSLDELMTQVERRLIENALGRSRHNKSRAAELLGISRPRLYRRIKELNLPDEPDPTESEGEGVSA